LFLSDRRTPQRCGLTRNDWWDYSFSKEKRFSVEDLLAIPKPFRSEA
jgi:hypothetical protein